MRRTLGLVGALGLALLCSSLATGGALAQGSIAPERASATRPAVAESQPDCGGQRPVKQTASGRLVRYQCTFSDEFTGSAFDPAKWMAQETWFSGMTTGNTDCYINSADNLSVSNGAAHVTARVEPEPFLCESPYGEFWTNRSVGTVATRGRFAQAYGRFAFRARFPQTTAPGAHPALWLYPSTDHYGGWPTSGEIDVAEWFSSRPSHVYPSVHYQGENPLVSSGGDCAVSAPGSWHTYVVEWSTTTMRFIYDGQECFRHSWTPDAPLVAPQPFDRPFYIVLTNIFGTAWNAPDASAPTSLTMDVDWVRAWK